MKKLLARRPTVIWKQVWCNMETRPITPSEEFGELPIGREALINLQRDDESLNIIFTKLKGGDKRFYSEDGLLMRHGKRGKRQIVLLKSERSRILKLAHDVPSAGNMGKIKTHRRVEEHFYWPGIQGIY